MSETHKPIVRFSIFERIEHVVLVISFTLLAVTGLPQKYALNPISQGVIGFFGGIEAIRVIHHIAAAVFLLEAVYHAVIVGYKLFVKRKEATMLPTIKDAKDAAQMFGYNLGIQKTMPKMPRYNFTEKAEYWAMLWGLVLMGLTGLMLWNPIATSRLLPGEFIPAAKAAHGAEAVLAVLAIILWHFYNVHIKHWNWSMIKGTISRHEMEVEHGEELERIQTGKIPADPEPATLRKRLALFVPVAAVFSLALVGLTYYFLTFETTSLTTLPPVERVEAFTRPSATPAPTQAPQPTAAPAQGVAIAWAGSIENMMQEKCSSCHGDLGGFNAESYEEVMKFVEPGSAENSRVVQAQQGGTHPGQFSDEELNLLIQWVNAGAPQEGDIATGGQGTQPTEAAQPTEATPAAQEPASTAQPALDQTWAEDIQPLFAERCASCHGTMGGFNAETYEEVLKQVTPGEPENSPLVDMQRAGTHPGQLTEEELLRVIEWITDGAAQ